MESNENQSQRIINLLDNTPNEQSKFRQKVGFK